MAYTPVLEAGAARHTGSSPVSGTRIVGVVVQLVRTPACHAGGREFESRQSRQLLGGRSTVGQQTLTLLIGVRIPASQPVFAGFA